LVANPALARMFGYGSPEELLAAVSSISDELYVDPARRMEFDRLVRRHDAVSGFEAQMYRRDGSVVWTSLSARAIRDPEGKLLGPTSGVTWGPRAPG
jgi:PAS domain S-box-containing protein